MSILSREDLEDSGFVTIGDTLQNIPSQGNAINIQVNNGGDGSTRINLRSLGTARTLVLLNGRRIVPGGTGADASADLNAIPLAVIERIEILKDGASALYGSDAVGGVVNIITRDNFDGQEATVYTGTTQRADGTVYDLSFVTGANSKKGNVVFSAGYSDIKPIFAGDRDFSKFDRGIEDWANPDVLTTGGSISTPGGTVFIDENFDGTPEPGNAAFDAVIANCPSTLCFHDPTTGEWRDFRDTGEPNDYYNYQPLNYLSTPLTRYNVFSSGSFKFQDHVRGFFEGLYLNRKSRQQIAPEPFRADLGVPISADSVYNPFGRDFNLFYRRMEETGTRNQNQSIDTFRLVTGLDGDLPDSFPLKNWRWELSFNYGRTQAVQIYQGNLVLSRLGSALGPSFMDGNVARCGTPAVPDNPATPEDDSVPANVIEGCVPLDLFGGPGSVTQAMADYIQYDAVYQGFNQQKTWLATAGGQLAKTPWGGNVSLAIGADYRAEAGQYTPDSLTSTGNSSGLIQDPTSGSYNVKEGFAELSLVPVVGKEAVKWLELDGAVRVFDYTTFGSGVTWKAGALFKTVAGVSLRGTYSTGFRAPSIPELFGGQSDSFPALTDPCDTSDPDNPPSPEAMQECAAQGVPATFQDPSGQLHEEVGGNPDLTNETAKIFTAGAVWEPPMVAGLGLTLDYFNTTIDKTITSIGADVIIANCYTFHDQPSCDKVHRDPNTHVIDIIDDLTTNIGSRDTAGLDFSATYQRDYKGIGKFRHTLEGTWLFAYHEQNALRTVNSLGVYDLSLVLPKLKANFTTLWGKGDAGAGFNIRYIGSMTECENNDCSAIKDNSDPSDDPLHRTIKANVTADVFGSYQFGSDAGKTTLAAGVNNVLDQKPPYIDASFYADSDTEYDFLGRYFYVRLTQLF